MLNGRDKFRQNLGVDKFVILGELLRVRAVYPTLLEVSFICLLVLL